MRTDLILMASGYSRRFQGNKLLYELEGCLLYTSGAIFLLVCDTLARTLLTIEIPISILTSLFGALVLIVLFMKGRLHV